MKTSKKIIYLLIALCLSFSFTNCIAVIIPDITSLGKDPVILAIEPEYLIAGEKVKIKGSNFFEYPKGANKLWINNYPVRILSSNKNTIEFIVPKISLGKAKIRFFTQYIGFKSKEIIYPDKNDFLTVTFKPPTLTNTERKGVYPN